MTRVRLATSVSDQHRRRQKRLEKCLAGHRTGAGTAAAVGRGEGLVQVQVHHVHAEVAGPRLAHQRVHVGAVHVEQRALGVQNVGDLVNLALEDADGGGVGEHQRGGFFVDLASERFKIDAAFGVRLEVLDRVAADGRGGWVGAVRGVGDEDLLARIALRLVPGADQQDAGELAVRAGRGLQRDGVHAGDFEQAALQQVDDFENALRQRVGPVGMGLGEAFNAGDQLVDARVVLHGAGAERIHAQVDGVVPGGEAREVANDFDLAQLGQQAAASCDGLRRAALRDRPRARRAGAACRRACRARTSRRRSASFCVWWGRTLPSAPCEGWLCWSSFMPPPGRRPALWRRCRSVRG